MIRSILKLLPAFLLLAGLTTTLQAQSISERVASNDSENLRVLSSVHAGAGQMAFTELVGRQDLTTNFLYLHAGALFPGGGIGHHFHHTIEEMYVVLDGEAEFTINGRTATIDAPVAVPNKLGQSHGVYNATDDTLRWLNFAVSTVKGQGDAFDLGDDRVGAVKDPVPTFVNGRIDRGALEDNNHPYVGDGALYRRILNPSVFSTSWSHVDHVVIPAGGSAGPHQLTGIEEVYYVMDGSGTVSLAGEETQVQTDDAFYGLIGETLSFTNNGSEDLEMIVIGISDAPKNVPVLAGVPKEPKAMVLQMDFIVSAENAREFEEMYHSIYVPAMTVQEGYLESKLLRLYPDDEATEIEAEPTEFNYQILISFDTEENRRQWVASDQHQIAWPAATNLAEEYKWRGYDVMNDHIQE